MVGYLWLVCRWWSGGQPVVHQWQITPSNCRLRATGGPPVAFLPLIETGGVMLSGLICP